MQENKRMTAEVRHETKECMAELFRYVEINSVLRPAMPRSGFNYQIQRRDKTRELGTSH